MFRICRTAAFVIIFFCSFCKIPSAKGEPVPPPPKQLAHVGILPPIGDENQATIARELLRETLGAYGFSVEVLEPADDPRKAFEGRPELDFVVTCILEQGSATAWIYDRQTETVRRLETRSEQPLGELAARILRHVSSQSSLESIVVRRNLQAVENLKEDPRNFQSLVLVGLALYHEEDFATAATHLEDATQVQPDDADAHYYLARCYAALDDRKKMVAQLERTLALDPQHEAASISLANEHLASERVHEAIAIYSRWLDSPQNASLAHWNIAIAYRRTGQPQQALSHLQQIQRGDLQYVRAQELILDLQSPKSAALPTGNPTKAAATRESETALTGWREIALAGLVCGLLAAALGGAGVWARRRRRRVHTSASTAHQETVKFPTENVSVPDPTSEHLPQQVGNYRLVAPLGQGGMGTVYRAVHVHLNKQVAVKLLSPHLVADAAAVNRFRREMLAVGRIDHPAIVRATDAGQAGGVHYLAMDYVDGVDLACLIRQAGPLPTADACEIIRQAAIALEHVHGYNMIHRDIKPSNLMLTRDGAVKLLDLGVAQLRDGPSVDGLGAGAVTQTGHAVGTIDYMSPEQAAGDRRVDHRADIYSLGCTLYALLAGVPPFGDSQHATPVSKAMAHVHEPFPSIRATRPELADELVETLDRMVAKSPADRFVDAASVATALAPLARGADLTRLRPVGQTAVQ